MSKQEWKAFESALRYMAYASLTIDGYKVSFERYISGEKLKYMVYVNGIYKGSWKEQDPESQFLYTMQVGRPQKTIKLMDALCKLKYKGKELKEEMAKNRQKSQILSPIFPSIAAIKRTYKKFNGKIQLNNNE